MMKLGRNTSDDNNLLFDNSPPFYIFFILKFSVALHLF